jgi:hypothetical protein
MELRLSLLVLSKWISTKKFMVDLGFDGVKS